jgi:glycosyltransferase involved in cell wall biosynthesis
MAAFNGAAHIGESIESLLAQIHTDFEIIIVDDCSSDATASVVGGYADPRIRLLRNPRNLGIVGARNRALAEARGEYIAILDQDDISRPGRLAGQVAYLDAVPGSVLVATDIDITEDGRVRDSGRGGQELTTPAVLRWMLRLGNPLVHSSVMFRAEPVRRLGVYLRQDYEYCEDYDFYLRLLAIGDIAILPELLTILRHHSDRASKRFEVALNRHASKLLADLYIPELGADAPDAADLVIRYLATGDAVPEEAALMRLGRYLDTLFAAYAAATPLTPANRARIADYTGRLWWRTTRASLRQGRLPFRFREFETLDVARAHHPRKLDIATSSLVGLARRLLA